MTAPDTEPTVEDEYNLSLDKDTLNKIVRDYTSISYPKSKSELRRRITALLDKRDDLWSKAWVEVFGNEK